MKSVVTTEIGADERQRIILSNSRLVVGEDDYLPSYDEELNKSMQELAEALDLDYDTRQSIFATTDAAGITKAWVGLNRELYREYKELLILEVGDLIKLSSKHRAVVLKVYPQIEDGPLYTVLDITDNCTYDVTATEIDYQLKEKVNVGDIVSRALVTRFEEL